MELLLPLWLPILLSAAAVWIVSIIASITLPHHKRCFIALPDEDGFLLCDLCASAVNSSS